MARDTYPEGRMMGKTMNAEAKHTPGPWAYDAERGEIYADDGDVCPLIATVNLDNVSHEQALADGLVLTAAPDMLEALLIVFKWFEVTGNSVNARWERIPPEDRVKFVKAMRAAIAKAEGR